MKKSIILLTILCSGILLTGQTPVGKWKHVTWTTEDVKGKKTDLLKDFLKRYPCMTTLVYIFSADGKIGVQADKCPPNVGEFGVGTKWTSSEKNKITISTDDPEIDPETYELEFNNDIMRWIINYGDDPDISNPEEIKVLTLVFRKV